MRSTLLACLLFIAPARLAAIEIVLEAGAADQKNLVVTIPLSLTMQEAKLGLVDVEVRGGKEPARLVGQLTMPSLVTERIKPTRERTIRRDLHVILEDLPAKSTRTLRVNLVKSAAPPVGQFAWVESKDGNTELIFTRSGTARPILRYMHQPLDESSKEARDKTYKVFHHLYDPEGKRFVTNGGHTDPHDDPKKLLFPHHRGLMFAFNRISYADGMMKADTWHCPKESQRHIKTIAQESGPVVGRHRVLVDWVGQDKQTFAKEEREMAVYHVPGGTLVEFATRLKTIGGPIMLDGDPQHAGFQFRAANQVAERTAKQTYYLRPDGKGKPGETRNWEPKSRKGPVDLPWNAMSFVLDDQRFTVAYIDHPSNPGEKRYSERDYGRFGCYFEYELTEANPLVLNHRVWLQSGEMTIPQVQALRDAFAAPPKATIK